jgi:hypothetical protein
MSLSETEKRFLKFGAAIGLDFATHAAAVKYIGMPARTVAAYALGIGMATYYVGMTASYLIDEGEGVDNYRYAMDEILGSPAGLSKIGRETFTMALLHYEPKARVTYNAFEQIVKHTARAAYSFGSEQLNSMVDRYTNDLLL